MAEAKEEKIKVRIPETSNFWGPKKQGECLRGMYCKKEPSTYMGRKNTLYTVKSTTHPIRDQDDMVKFYGTVVLNDVLGKIQPGYEVEIIYRGEQPSKDPKKKPTKLFEANFWVDPTDPILGKIYPDGLPGELQKQIDKLTDSAAGDEEPAPKSNDLNNFDDPQAREMIHDCETFLGSDGIKNPTPLEIAGYAEKIINSEDEPDERLLDGVQTILAREVIAECAASLATDDNLSPSEEEVAKCAKKMLKDHRPLLTKVQVLLAENVKSKKN